MSLSEKPGSSGDPASALGESWRSMWRSLRKGPTLAEARVACSGNVFEKNMAHIYGRYMGSVVSGVGHMRSSTQSTVAHMYIFKQAHAPYAHAMSHIRRIEQSNEMSIYSILYGVRTCYIRKFLVR